MRRLYFSSGTDSKFNEVTTLNNGTMKTTHNTNKLAFAKNSIVELNDDHLNTVNGGSLGVSIIVVISIAVGITVQVATQD